MCINVYKIILLVCMCCVGICWISCSGNSDDSEQTEVILSVDKNTLTADGKDIITFTVMHAGNGVHRNMVCHVSGRNDPPELSDKFELRGNCLSDVISC